MANEAYELKQDNERLANALRQISEHQREIERLLEETRELWEEIPDGEGSHVTDEDVKNLLKKYSRL